MKKLLLFLFFIFISLFESYSQQYKIKVSGFYGSGSSGCGTINGLRGITLITSSGKRISIHNRGYHRNQPFSGSKDFSQNDPVVKVEFFSTTRHKTWIGDCRSGRDARKTVNVSLPCFGKRYTKNQIFEGRTNRGYAYIEIIPLPQIKFTNGSSIYSTQTVCETSPVKLTSEFTSYRSPSTVYKWEFFDRVNKITRNTAGYQSLLNQLESAKQQWEDCLNNGGGLEIPRAPNNKNKKDNSPERAARPINGNCNFYFERVFELSTQVQNYSPKTEQVPIWRSIPSKNGKPAINLYLSNLYSRAADRAKALNNLKIQVRLNPGCNGDNDKSRTLSVQFLPEPPEVAKAPTFNQPLCSYSDVKGFVLYFKRQLYSHEKIEINLLRKFQNGSYVPEDDNVNIRTLTKVSTNVYKYTWRSSRGKSIKGGDYRIEVSGFNKANNSPFCKQYKYDFKISVPTPITYNAVRIQDELCYNSRNGKIKITASGGTGSYLYSLNNGSTWSKPFGGTITLSNKSSGTYLIKVKDTNGCIDKTKANVKVIIAKKNKITHVVTTSQTKHTSAPGNSDGSIKIGSVNGGTPTSNFYNYTVLLKGSSSNTKTGKAYKSGFIIPNLPAGIHKIVYKDKNNCTQQYTLPEIKDPKPITFSISSVKPDCYQGQGKVNIASISGGYPKYTVIIKKNGSTIKTLSNIASSTSVNVLSGSYSVLIKDTRQGKLEKTVVVASQSQVKITAINVNPIKCHSGKSTVTISATGGKSNSYQYAIWKGSSTVWQNSNTFSLAANTSSGYRFRVRDRNITSCFSAISSVKKITQPALLEVSNISVVDNKIFNGSIGKITLTIVGGTGSYSVTWKKKNATFTKTGNSISGLKAGFYTATIKDTNGCTINSREIEVKELPELKAQLKVTKIITCNGGKGNIQAVASGGSGSYTYKWKRNGVLLSNSGSVIVNVIQGNYSVTVSDSHTNKTAVIKLTEPTKVTLSIAKTDITCFNANNGKIKLTTNGGSGSYFYSIDNKASYKSTSTLSNNTIEGLAKGNYTIWLKDSKGCVIAGAKTTTINEPSVIGIESTSINNCDVPGGKTGSIAINITGGSGTYTYKWTKTGTPTFIKNIKNINSLYAGIYKIEVTDSKGCIKSKTFEVKEPKPINVTIKQTKQILCFGENSASLLAEVKGGYPLNSVPSDFTYKWYLVNGPTKTLLNSNFKLTELKNRPKGRYRVEVNDSKGESTFAEFDVNEPVKLSVSLLSSKDVSCFGGTNGEININVLGGVSEYKYKWSKQGDTGFSINTKNVSNLSKGIYSVEVTDANNCKVTLVNIEIKQPLKKLTIDSFTSENLKGFETNDGKASIEVSGGTPNYKYEWREKGKTAKIGSSKSINSLKAGEYELTIKDSNNCTLIKTFEITQPSKLEVSNITQVNDILCFGDSNVSLIATAKGGTIPYAYKWYKKGSTTVLSTKLTLDNISAGIYVLKVTDDNLIKTEKEFKVNQPLKLELSKVDVKNVLCYEGATGSISVLAKGGTFPYTYSWKHGTTGPSINSLTGGDYTVTIRDKNLCEVSKLIKVTTPATGLSISTEEENHVTGFGLSNGSIKVKASGGTPGYSYEWKDSTGKVLGSRTNELLNISSGTYTLVVSDAGNCIATTTHKIEEPLLLEAKIEEVSILCNGGTGQLRSKVTGGVSPYVYNWTDATGKEISTSTFIEEVSGVYNLEVTDENNNKAIVSSINLVEPVVLEFGNINVVDVLCYQGATGSISVLAKGGTFPYTYSWKHGATGPSINSLTGGDYTVTIRDKNLCEISKLIKVTTPATGLSIGTEEENHVTGFGLSNGSIKVKASGGTPGYSYEWKDSTGKVLGSTTNELLNISGGTYTLVVSDAGNCIATATYKIEEPLLLEAKIEEVSILCNGGTGQLRSKVTGGVSPYVYNWTDATGKEISTSTFIEEVSGVYNLEVIDENNNKAIVSSINLEEPLNLEFSKIEVVDVNCYGGATGSILVEVNGGTSPYTYVWKHSIENKNSVNGLKQGVYSVTITDKNGCSITNDAIRVNEPELYEISETSLFRPTSDLVNDGKINIKIVGGVSPYNYLWKNEKDEILKDVNSNFKNDEITSLGEGTYTIRVTDSKGCIVEETYNLANPGELLVSVEQLQEITCYNGNNAILDVITIGGAGGNKYTWYDASDDSIVGNKKQLTNIVAGKYYVIVDNAAGIKEKSPLYEVKEPLKIELDFSSENASCNKADNGSFKFNVKGGNNVYKYRYAFEGMGYSNWINVVSNVVEVKNLKPGSHKVQLIDGNNCFALNLKGEDEFTIKITEPLQLKITQLSSEEPTGYGLSNGHIEASIIGGTPPYSYTWFNSPGILTPSSLRIENLNKGTYTLKVEDSKGCSTEKTFELSEPEKLEVLIKRNSIISCNGSSNGEIQAIVSGGVKAYSYKWYREGNTSTIGTKAVLSNLPQGAYYVVITDTNNNTVRSSRYELTEPPILTLELTSDYVSCGTGTDWEVKSTVLGGTAPYTYLWNTGVNSSDLTNVKPGSYKLTVVDVNGCKITKELELVAPLKLEIAQVSSTTPTGYGLSNGHIEASVKGGTAPYNYSWIASNGILMPSDLRLENLAKGSYTLKVEDSKGCSTEKTFELAEPEKLEVSIKRNSIVSCNGASNGALQAIVNGGVKGYSYKWYKKGSTIFHGTKPNLSNLSGGTYYVVITDANNNSVTSSMYELREPSILELELTSDYLNCGTGNDWEVKSTVVGGTAPYSYLWSTGDNTSSLKNVKAGSYKLTVVDVNGCKVSNNITIVLPEPLILDDYSLINPTCYQGNDAEINLEVAGGAEPYSYKWSNGSVSKNINNLEEGIYSVIITDNKGCSISESFKVISPEKIKLDLGSDVTLCKGQSIILDGSIKDGVNYSWTSSNGFTSTDSMVEVNESGTYKVIATDKKGCTVTDEIIVKATNIDISANFIVSTQVFVNESFIAVNVSSPEPEESVWIVPSEGQIIEESSSYVEVLFDKVGEYEITLVTRIGECEEYITKKIYVIENDTDKDEVDTTGSQPMIKDFVVYPNPSSGKFKLDVKLKKENKVNVRIFGMYKNNLISAKKLNGKSEYTIDYDLTLVTGIYVVLIESDKERLVKKIIIK